MVRPIFEPFRIKVVEPIRMTSSRERRHMLEEAGYNLFGLRAEDVIVDLLTDSGTGAMSAEQWAAMMRGDESYAGARSWFRFERAANELTGMPFIFPAHQGRAAERILCAVTALAGKTVVSNGLFDTTRANIESAGATGIDLPVANAASFRGNMDLEALGAKLTELAGRIAFVVMTVTNNTVGGQPVSMRNLRAVSDRCREEGIPLFLDACRFAENAFAIRRDEPSEQHRTLHAIAREMFDLCDGFTMSAKKDAIVNIGGMLGVRDPALAEQIRVELIRTEGFTTYGGLAGRDLEAIAQGLDEVLDESYLAYRFAASDYLARALQKVGIPVLMPAAAHAVYVDAAAACPHLGHDDLPGQSLACAFYLAGGIRTCEIGDLMFGGADPVRPQLVRFALPRRVYTQSHIDYVASVAEEVAAARTHLPAMRILSQAPALRHFNAAMAPASAFPDFPDDAPPVNRSMEGARR